jgi:UDP-glucose 4-epimerase
VAIFANNNKAKDELGWIPAYQLEDMMSSAWNWELKLKSESAQKIQ